MVWLGDLGPIHRFTSLKLTEFYQYGQLYLWGSDRKGIIGPCHWTRKLTESLLGETSVKSTLAICPWLKQFHENSGVLWRKEKQILIPISAFHWGVMGNTEGCVPIQAAREELWGYSGFSSLKPKPSLKVDRLEFQWEYKGFWTVWSWAFLKGQCEW